jgi:anti-sigma-K factor RskA
MDHQALKDLLAMAALDRLDPDEQRALDEHLRDGCPECEAELRRWREAAAALALAGGDAQNADTEEEAGSEARIWQRLQARLEASAAGRAEAPARLESRADRPASRSAAQPALRGGVRRWQIATGMAVATALAVAIYAGVIIHAQGVQDEQLAQLGDRVSALGAQLAAAREATAALEGILVQRARLDSTLMAPDLELTRLQPLAPAPGASAIVAVSPSTGVAMLHALAMPPTPRDKTYELWWITKERGAVAAGLFAASAGREVIARAELPPTGQHVLLCAVTLEPAGGVAKPGGAMYLKGAAGHPEKGS